MFWRGRQMYRRLSEEVRAAGLAAGDADPEPVTEEQLVRLPATVQRYLRAMGVANRPRDWSFQAHFTGRFRLRGQGPWMPAEAWQYNSAMEVARVFHMRIDFAGVVPMVGRDTYLRGKGIMHGKLLGLVTVARSEGSETDLSELVTYLNDAVLLAPTMLLRLKTSFAPADDRCFDVTLVDAGQAVTARVFLDEQGRPVNFSTTDRYADMPGGLVRADGPRPSSVGSPTVTGSSPPAAAPSGNYPRARCTTWTSACPREVSATTSHPPTSRAHPPNPTTRAGAARTIFASG